MRDSLTLSLSETSAIIRKQYFPPIELASNNSYVLGWVELLTFNSVPNVGNNKLRVGDKVVVLPTGSYEIEDIERYVPEELALKGISINLKPNNKTLCSEIKCSHAVDLRHKGSIGRLLGFVERVLHPNDGTHNSD